MLKMTLALLALWLLSATKKHECKWDLCPYKEIVRIEWNDCIIEYGKTERSSDAYKADSVHLEHPTWEYDQIDSLLFNHK